MKVTLTHAYSTTNSGDGLLVDEAVAIVRAAFGNDVELSLIALDPASFDEVPFASIVHPLTGGAESLGNLRTLMKGAHAMLRGGSPRVVRELISSSDLVVAVGGGYMRAKAPVEAVKWLLTHATQLPHRRDRPPFVYLPQSIGPLRYGTMSLVRRRLQYADAVFLRDDRSVRDLGRSTNVAREPDMALLGLPQAWTPADQIAPGYGEFHGLVARGLVSSADRVRRYRDRVVALKESGFDFLAQATARGNNDLDFYQSLGYSNDVVRLRDAVSAGATHRAAVVVSVRLHGALQSIRSGVPAVHLSYERKGWGAYADLGLSEFVHNAFDFDPALVTSQAQALATDASDYWDRVSDAMASLETRRNDVIRCLQTAMRSEDEKVKNAARVA